MPEYQQVVQVSIGASEYTDFQRITETTGADITGDALEISLGTAYLPGTWAAPDVVEDGTSASWDYGTDQPLTLHWKQGSKLISAAIPLGTYWVWIKLTDHPEILPRKGHKLVVA
jgi:hypothetical protein